MYSMKLHQNFFYFLIYSSYLIYILSIFNIFPGIKKYSVEIHYIIVIYISIFLLYEFNPFNKTTITDFHKEIIFHSGLILFGSTALAAYFLQYIKGHKNMIKHQIDKL